MNQILEKSLIDEYNQNGAVLIKGKFDHYWIDKLKEGFKKAKSNPSPRFVNHTKDKNSPSYYEDFWTWNLIPEFNDFVFPCKTRDEDTYISDNDWLMSQLIFDFDLGTETLSVPDKAIFRQLFLQTPTKTDV